MCHVIYKINDDPRLMHFMSDENFLFLFTAVTVVCR